MIDFKLVPVDTLVEYYVKGPDKNEAVSIGFFRRVDADSVRPFIVSPYPTIVGNKSEIGTSKVRISAKNPWLPWFGGDCPVPPNCMVDVYLRDTCLRFPSQLAGNLTWTHDDVHNSIYIDDCKDIIAYRLIESQWQTIDGDV
jgi:hypothetical protein